MLSGIRSTYPLVKIKAAVSAMARPIPNIKPAAMEGAAAGNKICHRVANLLKPSAAALWRQPSGTAESPASVVRIRMGNTMQAKVNPPAAIE